MLSNIHLAYASLTEKLSGMANRGGLLTRVGAIFGRVFLKRELAGVDPIGNKYYT